MVKDVLGIKPGFKIPETPPTLIAQVALAAWEHDLVSRATEMTSGVLDLWREHQNTIWDSLSATEQARLVNTPGGLNNFTENLEAVVDCFGSVPEWYNRQNLNLTQAEMVLRLPVNQGFYPGAWAGAACYFTGLAEFAHRGPKFEQLFVRSCVLMAIANVLGARGIAGTEIHAFLREEAEYQDRQYVETSARTLALYLDHPPEMLQKVLEEVMVEYKPKAKAQGSIPARGATSAFSNLETRVKHYVKKFSRKAEKAKEKGETPDSGSIKEGISIFNRPPGPGELSPNDMVVECDSKEKAEELARHIEHAVETGEVKTPEELHQLILQWQRNNPREWAN